MGHVAWMWKRRDGYKDLSGKPGEKRPLVRLRRRLESNIKMDLQELGFGA